MLRQNACFSTTAMGDWLELAILRHLLNYGRVSFWVPGWFLASTLRWNVAVEPTVDAFDKVSWLIVLWGCTPLFARQTLLELIWAVDKGAHLSSVARVSMLIGLRRLRTPSLFISRTCRAASVVSSQCHSCNSIDLALYERTRLVRRITLSVRCWSVHVTWFLSSRDRQRSCLLNWLFCLLSTRAGDNMLMNVPLNTLCLSLMLDWWLGCKVSCRNFEIRAYF